MKSDPTPQAVVVGSSDVVAALIAQMSAQGFEPSRVYNAYYLEFTKTYADALGRLARAVVQFERPTTPLSPGTVPRLSGFTVLVQAQIEATEQAIVDRAPAVMQPDLLAVLASCSGADFSMQSMATECCSLCSARISEFFILQDEVVCRDCKETCDAPAAKT